MGKIDGKKDWVRILSRLGDDGECWCYCSAERRERE